MKKYVLVIDEGATDTRALIFNNNLLQALSQINMLLNGMYEGVFRIDTIGHTSTFGCSLKKTS